mmetsp:Transcript_31578/g.66156  ORF Transcript_31578/g.66156 Transcript_31578/m.66156 type:complete len:81 (-) Transcript_31578:1871-2113(-)
MEPVGFSSLICWAMGVDDDGRGGVGASKLSMREELRVNDNGRKTVEPARQWITLRRYCSHVIEGQDCHITSPFSIYNGIP